MNETFWTLLRDSAHWEFEIFLMLLFDGVIAGLCWPFVRRHWQHHIDRDRLDATPGGLDWSLNHPIHRRNPYHGLLKYTPKPIVGTNASDEVFPERGDVFEFSTSADAQTAMQVVRKAVDHHEGWDG